MAYESDKTIGELEDLTLATGDLLVFGDVTDSDRAKKLTIDALDTYLSATTKTLTNKTLEAVGITMTSETASTIASLDASKNIKSLATSTYPSLTELSYVKGVTSSLQTQITARALKGANTDITSLGGLTTPLTVAQGGTGIATATAYAVICAGTTATGAFQSLASLGTSGQVLTSNGAGALPTFQSTTIYGIYTASTNILLSADTERMTSELNYTKLKEIRVIYNGTYRVEYQRKTGSGYARVYKNGVAFGAESGGSEGYYVPVVENLVFSGGDLIQLYAKKSSADVYVKEFRICGDIVTASSVITD